MNFEGLLAQLKPPPESGEKFFSAIPIYKHSNHRIAINFKGFPYILICVDNDNGLDKRKKIKLKYMNILEYVECNVIEYKKKYTKRFTIIGFESYDKALQLYFLKIGEILLSTVGNTPSYNEVRKCILGFVELFKSMNEPPLKSIQGLWGELFLISNALIPNVLISSWHKNPEDKFDFSLNSDHIEVKTTAVNKREHNFSLEQLNTSKESNVIIASLFVNKVSLGTSIMSLIDIIEKKPEVNTDMIYYLNFIISKTLGNTLEEAVRIFFDYKLAKNTLRYYHQKDIPNISFENIPKGVSNVKFRSDLSNIKNYNLNLIRKESILFNSL